VFTLVLVKHSKSFSPINCAAVGVEPDTAQLQTQAVPGGLPFLDTLRAPRSLSVLGDALKPATFPSLSLDLTILGRFTLLNRAGCGGKGVVGIASDQPDCPHHQDENNGQHYCIFSDVLAVVAPTELAKKMSHVHTTALGWIVRRSSTPPGGLKVRGLTSESRTLRGQGYYFLRTSTITALIVAAPLHAHNHERHVVLLWLGGMQPPFGGIREAALLSDRNEITQMTKFHCEPPMLSRHISTTQSNC
jgi:hypothetical protein